MWRQGSVLDLMLDRVDLVVQKWSASRGPDGLAGVEFGRGKKERGVGLEKFDHDLHCNLGKSR